jgi:hypothetical protein
VKGSPKISVLLPCFSQERFVRESVESVLAQDFTDWELVASDDASPDNTFSILQEMAQMDPRIRLFHQKKNLGMVANWNFCLHQARGEAVKLMGGDDRLDRTDCLCRQWQSLQTPGVALVACARRIIDESSSELEALVNLPSGVFSQDKIIPKMLVHQDNLIGEPVCCLFRRADAGRGFNPRYRQNTDIEMWLYLLQKGGLAYDVQPLVAFRTHGSQASIANWHSGVALEEHRLLMLEQASSYNIPPATKFHVLCRAENALRFTPSTKIREASEQLAQQLGWKNIFIYRILHHVRRTLSRWKRSISKRIIK